MHKYWDETTKAIREHLQKYGMDSFPSCGELAGAMVVSNGSHFIFPEFNEVMKDKRYRKILNDPTLNIEKYTYHLGTTANTIHHVYHLLRLEKYTGKRIDKLESIVEIGGGYGNMARLCYKLGFRGQYIIHDLEPLTDIQQYYLNRYCPELKCEWNVDKNDPDLLISTWALSEIPLEERQKYLDIQPKNVLLAFQNQFFDVNNIAEFDKYYTNINREIIHIEQIDWSYYMLGEK